MQRYIINYDDVKSSYRKEINIKGKDFILIFSPINKLNTQNVISYFSLSQNQELQNILYHCFKNELQFSSISTVTKQDFKTSFPNNYYGCLTIFDKKFQVIGFMLYNDTNLSDTVIIENVCFSESIQGKGYFKAIFSWFLKKIKSKENGKSIGLYVWNQNISNKRISKLYEKFSFKFVKKKQMGEKSYDLMILSE
ncbi:hypothetical protein CPAV1605_593 [seawater metagenome]|uniref:Uncharacterized protein n=1 Tax=seawater metagenome TaxID=1561972 RepID=A0A5E8CHJ1_9ZZZZ